MGPKKKTKTAEQKLLLLEQKRLLEEEMERKKKELFQKYIKNKTEKEEKTSKLNCCILLKKWREILREVKSEDLKKEVLILQNSFERTIDHLKMLITNTYKEIEDAEEQQALAFRSHLKNEDYLISQQHRTLKILQDQYDDDLELMKNEFEKEREMIIQKHDKEIKDLQDIIYAMDYDMAEKDTDTRSDFLLIMDDLKNKDVEDHQTLRVMLEGQVEVLWNQLQMMLKRYNESTESRNKILEDLKMRDSKSIMQIDSHMKKLHTLQESITFLKNKLWTITGENEKTNKLLREERDTLMYFLRDMKNEMKNRHRLNQARLVELSVNSERGNKSLTQKIKLCENILRCAESCRKMETLEEKITPFYKSSLTEEEEEKIEEAMKEEPVEKISAMANIYLPLENFWKRYNKVVLETMALDKEKGKLMDENAKLRFKIKTYIKSYPLEEIIQQKPKPLIYRPSSGQSRVRHFVIPVVEAAEAIKSVIAADILRTLPSRYPIKC